MQLKNLTILNKKQSTYFNFILFYPYIINKHYRFIALNSCYPTSYFTKIDKTDIDFDYEFVLLSNNIKLVHLISLSGELSILPLSDNYHLYARHR